MMYEMTVVDQGGKWYVRISCPDRPPPPFRERPGETPAGGKRLGTPGSAPVNDKLPT